jgi:hypothetical protein
VTPLHAAAEKYAPAIKAVEETLKQLDAATSFRRLAQAAYEKAEDEKWAASNELTRVASES